MQLTVKDKSISTLKSSRVYDDNGFLRVPAKTARTGIQEYLAKELGLTDRNPMDVINVYRPPEEVFDSESLKSYKDVDVTIEHPSDMVTSDTYDAVSVGHVTSEGRKDGDWVVADLIIKSKDAIREIESGKVEVSMGYSMDLAAKDGIDPVSGKQYEFVQKSLKMNHIALTALARAGHEARIFDNNSKKVPQMKVTLTDGLSVSFDSEEKAQLVKSAFDSLLKRATDAEKKAEDMEEEKEKANAAKDMAEEELKKEKEKTTDSAMKARISAISKAIDSAKKLAGKEFSCDSYDVMTIKRAALAKVKDSVDWSDKSDAYVEGMFDAYSEKKEAKDQEEEEEKKKASDSHKNFGKDASSITVEDAQAARQSARDSYLSKRYSKGE